MKKALSIVLALVLLFTTAIPAFADEGKCDCGITPTIHVRGFGDLLYLNPDSKNPMSVFPPDASSFVAAVPDILGVVRYLAQDDYDMFGKKLIDAADKIIGKWMCDENGKPVYNVGLSPEDYSLPTEDKHGELEMDNYTFHYDWRLSAVDNAKRLHSYVERVMELTGHDKVSFTCHSQGNTVIAAYLYEYGNEGIDTIIFMSGAYQGLEMLGDLFTKNYELSGQGNGLALFLESFLGYDIAGEFSGILVKILEDFGVMDPALDFLQNILDEQFDRVYADYLTDMFGRMAGTWAFVPSDVYEQAKETMFADNNKVTDEFIEKIDYYHDNIQIHLTDIIDSAIANGVKVAITCGYGISTIPISTEPEEQSDMLIDTRLMSLGATCAYFGETLGDGYVQSVGCGHNHIDPENTIDASTCAYPEYTWFMKGQEHPTFKDSYVELIEWILSYDGQPTVFDDERYPQFVTDDGNGNLIPVSQSGKVSVIIFITRMIKLIKSILSHFGITW